MWKKSKPKKEKKSSSNKNRSGYLGNYAVPIYTGTSNRSDMAELDAAVSAAMTTMQITSML